MCELLESVGDMVEQELLGVAVSAVHAAKHIDPVPQQ